ISTNGLIRSESGRGQWQQITRQLRPQLKKTARWPVSKQPTASVTTSKRSAVARANLNSVSLGCMALPARDLLYEKQPSGRQNKNPNRAEFLPAFWIIYAPSDWTGDGPQLRHVA